MSRWQNPHRWRKWARTSVLPVMVVALIIAPGCSDDEENPIGTRVVDGSGIVVEEFRPVSGFSGVSFGSEGNLHIVLAQEEGLRIEADDNLLDEIITEVEDGTLSIRTAPGVDLRPSDEMAFYVDAMSVDHLLLGGVGEVVANGLSADRFSVALSGVGSITLTGVEANELDLALSGVGGAMLTGQVSTQTVTLSGVCNYQARQLTSEESIVTLSGIGSVEVYAESRLVGTITGEGDICYLGEPAVESKVTGVGTIAPCEPDR